MCRSSAQGGRRCTGSAANARGYETARKRLYRARRAYDTALDNDDNPTAQVQAFRTWERAKAEFEVTKAENQWAAAQTSGDRAAIRDAHRRVLDAVDDLDSIKQRAAAAAHDAGHGRDGTPPAPRQPQRQPARQPQPGSRPTVVGTYVDGPANESVFTNFGTIITGDGHHHTGNTTNTGAAGHSGDGTPPPADLGQRIADQVNRTVSNAMRGATRTGTARDAVHGNVIGENHGTAITNPPGQTWTGDAR